MSGIPKYPFRRLSHRLSHGLRAPWLLRVRPFLHERRFFPETGTALGRLVLDAGFEPKSYRNQSQAHASAIADESDAVRHLLHFCAEEQLTYPVTLDPDGFGRIAEARCWNRAALAGLMSSLVNSHLLLHPESLDDPRFWQVVTTALHRVGRPYLLVGDSHSRACRVVGTPLRDPIIPVHVLCTAGSALGLDNPRSRSGYGARLARLASVLARAGVAPRLPVLLQFGQVDVEFVSVFRRIGRGERRFERAAFEAFCDAVADAYGGFVARHFGGVFETHLVSLFPPALSDEAWADGYVNAHVAGLEGDRPEAAMAQAVRGLEIPSLRERTALHHGFNERLRRLCREGGHGFVDLFAPFLGTAGTIDPRFIATSAGRDHHVDFAPARPVIRDILDARLRRRRGAA